LIAALRSGRLGAAILDVQRQEPLPAGSPLWDAPNIYLSPHSSASAEGYADRVSAIFADNVIRYLEGRPMVNLVDPADGY
ncbi:MAG TPA: NAD(P)-dependent oxidoreductase, partial [Acidimicrobiales bacterium]|nr:NAD(P)-dependent oxidoreductase [Acidimicrobiales bacterium]